MKSKTKPERRQKKQAEAEPKEKQFLQTDADRLGITQPAVSRLAQRGENLAIENNLFFGE